MLGVGSAKIHLFFGRGSVTEPAEVPLDFEFEQSILLLGSLSDIVNDEGRSSLATAVANQHDVNEAIGKAADHEIPCGIVLSHLSDRERLALALEKLREVGHAAMVDVGICPGEFPNFRIH